MTLPHTVPPCVDPSRSSRVLDGVRRGGALSEAELAHVAGCESCHDAVERLRRVGAVWAHVEPSSLEIQRARARFFAVRAGRRKVKMAPISLALAVLLVAAAASAAVRVGMKYMRSTQRPSHRRSRLRSGGREHGGPRGRRSHRARPGPHRHEQ